MKTTDPHSLHRVLTVAAPVETAWSVFTGRIGDWWPLATHRIGGPSAVDAVIEPFVGGRWYEVQADGTTCAWGRVLTWEPPARLILAWQITAGWEFSPELHTEVEVRFTPTEDGQTRVELEHRGLDRYGPDAPQVRAVYDSPDGWTGLLAAFARRAEEQP